MLRSVMGSTNCKHCLLLFAVFCSTYFISTVGIMNSSEGSQYNLTRSLVHDHTFQIDKYQDWIFPDYAYQDGHYYSIRSPAESILLIPFYIFAQNIKSITRFPYNHQHPGINDDSGTEAVSVLWSSTCGALAIVALYLLILRRTSNHYASLISTVSLGLGSLIWKYSATLMRHSAVICFILIALYLLEVINKYKPKVMTISIVSGFLLGLAASMENMIIWLIPIFGIQIIMNRQLPRMKIIFTYIIACTIPIIMCQLINLNQFGKIFVHPIQFAPEFPFYHNISVLSSSPLLPSVYVNAFNTKSIPRSALSPFIYTNPEVVTKLSAEWAQINQYKGIFIQSPYLFLSIFGIMYSFIKIKDYRDYLVLISVVILHFGFSKYIVFYSPTMYDTRLFLPVVALLTIFCGYFWKFALITKKFKWLYLSFGAVLIMFSIFNGWKSNFTNYAPHVTGEHRNDVMITLNSNSQFMNQSYSLINHTFPNLYNFHIVLLYFGLIWIIWYVAKLILCKPNNLIIASREKSSP